MSKKPQGLSRTLKGKINAFEVAVRDHAFMGTQRPDDWPPIEERWHEARHALEHSIMRHIYAARKK